MDASQPQQKFVLQQTALLTNNFNVWLDGAVLAQFHGVKFRWTGQFEVADGNVTVVSDSMLKSDAHMEDAAGTRVCDGVAHGVFKWTYTVTCAGGSWVVTSGRGDLVYAVSANGVEVGTMQGSGMGASNGYCTLPASMPKEAKLMVFWLMAKMWRKSSANNVTVG
jgi:hypothetical protein